jgi:hypothetical protein
MGNSSGQRLRKFQKTTLTKQVYKKSMTTETRREEEEKNAVL